MRTISSTHKNEAAITDIAQIALLYSLFSNRENLKDFSQNMKKLQELENTIESPSPVELETLKLTNKAIENGLELNQLFKTTKASFPEILQKGTLIETTLIV